MNNSLERDRVWRRTGCDCSLPEQKGNLPETRQPPPAIEKKVNRTMGRLLLAVTVLGVGIGVATMYRKPAETKSAEKATTAWNDTLVLRDLEGNTPTVVIPSEPATSSGAPRVSSAPLTGAIDRNSHTNIPPAVFGSPRTAPVSGDESPRTAGDLLSRIDTPEYSVGESPPELASAFPQAEMPPLPQLTTTTNRQPLDEPPVVNAPRETAPLETVEETENELVHTIRDGDSLEKLAKWYLGDVDRAQEIFEMNRDVLSDPMLLPIGTRVQLPRRTHRVPPWPSREEITPTMDPLQDITAASNDSTSEKSKTMWIPVDRSESKEEKSKTPTEVSPQEKTPRSYAPPLVPISDPAAIHN